MKWFKHLTESHTNLKLKPLIRKHGLEGYAIYFLLLEFVGKHGSNYKISTEKEWKCEFLELFKINKELFDKVLETLASLNLISKNGLIKGNLCIPKMSEYADEYTDKIGRKSRQSRDNVFLDKIRLDKNRIEYTYKDIFNFWNEQNIIKHRFLTGKMKTKIRSAMKEYSLEDVKKAISNYSIVLKGKEYYWTYKWTIEDFLNRGLTRFLETPLENFLDSNNNKTLKID